eukprot:5698077-Pyramimonas_sp.AAC.1
MSSAYACDTLAPAAHLPWYLRWGWLLLVQMGTGWQVQAACSALMLLAFFCKRRGSQAFDPCRRPSRSSQFPRHEERETRQSHINAPNDLQREDIPWWLASVRTFKRFALLFLSCKPLA